MASGIPLKFSEDQALSDMEKILLFCDADDKGRVALHLLSNIEAFKVYVEKYGNKLAVSRAFLMNPRYNKELPSAILSLAGMYVNEMIDRKEVVEGADKMKNLYKKVLTEYGFY